MYALLARYKPRRALGSRYLKVIKSMDASFQSSWNSGSRDKLLRPFNLMG